MRKWFVSYTQRELASGFSRWESGIIEKHPFLYETWLNKTDSGCRFDLMWWKELNWEDQEVLAQIEEKTK